MNVVFYLYVVFSGQIFMWYHLCTHICVFILRPKYLCGMNLVHHISTRPTSKFEDLIS